MAVLAGDGLNRQMRWRCGDGGTLVVSRRKQQQQQQQQQHAVHVAIGGTSIALISPGAVPDRTWCCTKTGRGRVPRLTRLRQVRNVEASTHCAASLRTDNRSDKPEAASTQSVLVQQHRPW